MGHQSSSLGITLRGALLKGLLLFLLINLVFASFDPLPSIGRLSAYNCLLPGRLRLPYGDRPDLAYNLSLFNLPAMFASHELSGVVKSPQEFRVILIGDSSAWGFLLTPQQTLSATLNSASLKTASGKQVRVYNLGYPTMSLTKDLLILDQAMAYHPDLILWLVTLESFPKSRQLASPILQHNPAALEPLISAYHLDIDPDDQQLVTQTYLQRTIIGQRRELADIFRLQLYGVLWAATVIDQHYPQDYEPPLADLPADESFHDLNPPSLDPNMLALDVIEAGFRIAGDLPVLLVNEPVYISQGDNSDIRYNFFYPRWAYDQYRTILAHLVLANSWDYNDAWDLIPASEFTNSAIHFSPSGEAMLAEMLRTDILSIANR